MGTPRKSHVAKVRQPTPLERVDAEIAERLKRIRDLEDRLKTCPADELISGGNEMQRIIDVSAAEVRDLRERRVRIMAGVAEPIPPSPPAAKPATVAKAWTPPKPLGAHEGMTEDDVARFAEADAVVRSVVTMYGANASAGLFQACVVAMAAVATSRDVLVDVIREQRARIEALEARAADPPAIWQGTYQRALGYPAGVFVGHDGSAWVALRAVGPGEIPGQAPTGWQLAVKAGRDGKDLTRA